MLPLKVYVLSEQGDQTQMKIKAQVSSMQKNFQAAN